MKPAYATAYLVGKTLDMVLPGIFAFVRPSRRKTTLCEMNKCLFTVAILHNVFGISEVFAEGKNLREH